MDKSKYGVHETHCCIEHGCKYGDKDCPVVKRKIVQKYICEDCHHDGIKSVEELLSKVKYLTKEQKEEIIRNQTKTFRWGEGGLIICKECLSIFKVSWNNDKAIGYCPFCGSKELGSYSDYNTGKLKI